ncbi:MAG: hypothetical protein ACQ5SW_08165 [Sphaerochaetaceae bacterium]
MRSTPYRFTRFSLLKAPGFLTRAFGDLNEIHPGLNILTGANGVGKTTIIKALWSLLFSPNKHPLLEAEGVLEIEGEQWHLSLIRQHLEQKRLSDGLVAPLAGRNDEFADAYWFPLHELLSSEGAGTPFLEAIQKEMQGGIDLKKAVQAADGIASFSNKRFTLMKVVKERRENVERQKEAILTHMDLQQQIQKKRAALKDSLYLMEEKSHLETLLEYLSDKKEFEATTTQLESFDPLLGKMTEHSLEEARKLEKDHEAAQSLLEQLKGELNETKQKFLDCNVSQSLLEDLGQPGLIERQSEELDVVQKRLYEAKKMVIQASEGRKAWEESYRWIVPEAPKEKNLEQMVKRLKELAYVCEPLRCNLASSAQIAETLGEEAFFDARKIERLREAKQYVSSLMVLAARRDSTSPIIRMKRSHMAVYCLLVSCACACLGLFIHPAMALLTLPLLGFLFFLGERGKENPMAKQIRTQLAEGLEQANSLLVGEGEPPLESSDLEAITRQIGILSTRIAVLERQETENEKRRSAKKAFTNAQTQWDAWLHDWEAVASDLHLTPNPTLEGAQFFHFSEQLHQWVIRLVSEQEAVSLLHNEESSFQAALTALQKVCASTTTDVLSLRNEASVVISAINKARNYKEQLEKDERRLLDATKRAEEAEKTRTQWYESIGLPVGDVQMVERLDSLVLDYQKIVLQQQIISTKLTGYDEQLSEEAEMKSVSALQVDLEDVRTRIMQRETEQKELWEMERTYQELCSDTALENAELELLEAQQSLEDLRHKEVEKRMVYQLFEQVEEQMEHAYQPQVLQKASEWLKRITQNRYVLSVGDEGFLAKDAIAMRSYSLDQLSSGTRIQLLFAIRMAFLELLEGGGQYRFPVFFDELMANSDDERSLAIAQAIVEIAKQRQVFYCTAQHDEVQKLKTVGNGDIHLINLEDAMRAYHVLQYPFVEAPVERIALPPFHDDYQAYAKACNVAGPALWEPIGSLSSWYLCSTSQELEQLLARNYATAGQAKSVSSVYGERFHLLAAAQALARIGRPKLLSCVDLDDDDLNLNRKAAFYARLLSFLEGGNKNGNDILAAIEEGTLKGFRESTKEMLSSWLYEHGFASAEHPYAHSAIMEKLSMDNETFQIGSEAYGIVERYLNLLGITK